MSESFEISDSDLTEAKRQIESLIHKLERALESLESKDGISRLKSQITLANRRIRALKVCDRLISRELERSDGRSV